MDNSEVLLLVLNYELSRSEHELLLTLSVIVQSNHNNKTMKHQLFKIYHPISEKISQNI